jgi:hypothetical protein
VVRSVTDGVPVHYTLGFLQSSTLQRFGFDQDSSTTFAVHRVVSACMATW